ncbi:MAG: hypothetical protein EPN45_12305, partial [Rhizobiaceae bacterium]
NPGLQPRRTKLEMPGWGGSPHPRKDGSHQQVWHCMPFTEGAQYGFEVCQRRSKIRPLGGAKVGHWRCKRGTSGGCSPTRVFRLQRRRFL